MEIPTITLESSLDEVSPHYDTRSTNGCKICQQECIDPSYCRCSHTVTKVHQKCILETLSNKFIARQPLICEKCHFRYKVQYGQHWRPSCDYICRRVKQNKCKCVLLHVAVAVLLAYLLYYVWLMLNVMHDPKKQILKIVMSILAGTAVVVLLVTIILWVYEYLVDDNMLVKVLPYSRRRCRKRE
jgi:hypothetical protein